MRASEAFRSRTPSSSRRPTLELRLARGVKASFDPGRRSQFRPHVCGRVRSFVADAILPRGARRPAHAGAGGDPALLRALRLLHRHLPDLCDARRRARQPARAHLSDQGPAGDRPQADGRRRLADRPLPLLPLLHDDLPVRRRLSPPDRRCARADRGDLHARRSATGCCARCWCASCPRPPPSAPRSDSPGSAGCSSRCSNACRASGRGSPRCWRSRRAPCPPRAPDRRRSRRSRRRRPAPPHGAAHRLRAERARAAASTPPPSAC